MDDRFAARIRLLNLEDCDITVLEMLPTKDDFYRRDRLPVRGRPFKGLKIGPYRYLESDQLGRLHQLSLLGALIHSQDPLVLGLIASQCPNRCS